MIYTEQITLEQALDLQNRIEAGEMPDIKVCYLVPPDAIGVFSVGAGSLKDIPNLDFFGGGDWYLTRSDYATYIIGNKPVPEGYGYPSKELSSRIYDSLPYKFCFNQDEWSDNGSFECKYTTVKKWHQICFKLTDLARVEAEAVVSEMERTEINAAQVEWLSTYKPETNFFYYDEDGAEFHWKKFESSDSSLSDRQYKYKLLTSTYNSLPNEFKALAEKPFAEKYKEALADPKPSMPAHFTDSTDWKAKYNELERATTTTLNTSHGQRSFSDYVNGYCGQLDLSERVCRLEAEKGEFTKQLQEATASADSKQQAIEAITKVNNELGDCLRAARDYIEKLEQLGNTQTLLERHTKEKEFAQSAYYETLPF